jgi:hypothetical protein
VHFYTALYEKMRDKTNANEAAVAYIKVLTQNSVPGVPTFGFKLSLDDQLWKQNPPLFSYVLNKKAIRSNPTKAPPMPDQGQIDTRPVDFVL